MSQTVEYKDGETVLEGYLAYDDTTELERPAVLVVHAWMGLDEHAKAAADRLASQGYVAFAADIYGKGVRPQSHEEAGKAVALYKNDRSLLRGRIGAALEIVKNHPYVDEARIAAIGYCFGGTTVLELARSGADVDGVVSFHGLLSTPTPADAKNIKGRVLVLHGADDPYVPRAEVDALEKEMKDASADWHKVEYPGAVHSFTVKSAGSDPSTGAAYDAQADAASWEETTKFLKEIFR
jgi:dienelactone hydrolase